MPRLKLWNTCTLSFYSREVFIQMRLPFKDLKYIYFFTAYAVLIIPVGCAQKNNAKVQNWQVTKIYT